MSLRDYSNNSKQKPNNAPISRRITTNNPTKRNNGDSLDVPDHCTAHSASLVDDVELRYVDHARTESALFPPSALVIARNSAFASKTHQKHQHPPIQRHFVEDGKAVGPRDDVQQQRRSDRRLVRQQLHAVHAEFGMVHAHPDRVDGAAQDAAEGEHHPGQRRRLGVVALAGPRVEVRRHAHAGADGQEREHGGPGQRLLVQEEVERGDGGREEDAADLVEGDGGVGQGEVLQYHVQAHGGGQGKHFEDLGPFGLEEAEAGAGEEVEERGGHEEVVGCEG